jgi:hypothetical protein
MLGRGYPAGPTFGLPCPTTIFTFGIFLYVIHGVRWYMIIIPLLWSIIGFSAAWSLSIGEDFGLVIAGVTTTLILLLSRSHKETTNKRVVTIH